MYSKKLFILFSLASILLLQGCAAVVVSGAATGVSVAHDRRTTGTFIEDQEILVRAIALRQNDADLKQRSNISIDVFNLAILMTGQAEDAELVSRYQNSLSQIARVATIHNEVLIGAESTWGDAAQDTYLTSRVKLALFGVDIENFDLTRVKVTSSLGNVYLMGLLTTEEADAVTERVRFVSGVKRVIRLFEYSNR